MEIEKIDKSEEQIDQNLYSRQIGAFGIETMSKLVKLKVLLVGLSGVGLEVAKNLILSGPKQIQLFDNRKCHPHDLEFNYYLKPEDLTHQQTRAEHLLPHLKQLNSYVEVSLLSLEDKEKLLNEQILNEIDLVIVCDFYPLDFLYRLNDKLRELNKGLIITATAGFLGFVFTDFVNHNIFDKNGENVQQSLIASIDENGMITCDEKSRHGLEEGDVVKLDEIVGMEQLNGKCFKIQKILSPYVVNIGNLEGVGNYLRNGIMIEQKQIVQMKFKSLREVLEIPLSDLIDCSLDFTNDDRVLQLKVILRTLWKYFDIKGIPQYFENDKEFLNLLKKDFKHEIKIFEEILNKNLKPEEKISKKDWMKVLETNLGSICFALARGTYPSICSYFGGIAAQEAVKYTGKFTPINHIFIHEFYSNMFKNKKMSEFQENKEAVQKFQSSRYLSHYALFGEKLFQQFKNNKVLLVGSGALGCEYLKMFSISGLCCSQQGKLTVVDDDQIEISNLNRQFLFRNQHIGQSKSEIGCQVSKTFNPEFNAHSIQSRLQPTTENQFTDVFWDNIDFIVNAVDNIQARRYVDQKAVLHEKAFFESGTLGTKCNSQLILPGKTECYSDSQDPEEKQIPLCTMRSFPHLIDHCIEWGRVKFFDVFVKPSRFLKEFFENVEKAEEKVADKMKNDMPELLELSEHLIFYVSILKQPILEEYVKLAILLYQEYFDTKIAELLALFPPDYIDKEGRFFWTAPKRPPIILPFDKENPDHINFVLVTIKILNQIIPMQENCDDEKVKDFLKEFKISRKKIQVKQNREEVTNEDTQKQIKTTPEDQEKIQKLMKELVNCVKLNKVTINEIDFEKDDEKNGHIDFITFYSNFRASNYSIKNAPRHQVKLIAGKITPAIATSTAMVCGTIGIEIYKYHLNLPITEMRNYFSNLAIPIFAFSEPIPPVVQKDKDYDVILMGPLKTIPKNWNTWSRLELKGPLTLQQAIDQIYQNYKFTISSVICNEIQIYINFIPNTNYRLKMKIEDILEEVGRKRYEGKKYELFNVAGEDDEGLDIYCPFLKYHLGQ